MSVTDKGEQTTSSGRQESGSVALGISADGRHVVFRSDAPNLAGTNPRFNVFVRDRVSGRTSRVSVSSTGRAGNAFSQSALISANGRYVVFESQPSNLVRRDTNGVSDFFVRVFQHHSACRGTLTRTTRPSKILHRALALD